MGWTRAARERALVALLRDGVYVGLIRDDGKEESASRRQQVAFTNPSLRSDGVVVSKNKENVTFPPYEKEPNYVLAKWAIYDRTGTELVRGDLVGKFRPPAGLQIVFIAGDIEVGLAEGQPMTKAAARSDERR
jgi:hypothetical protein